MRTLVLLPLMLAACSAPKDAPDAGEAAPEATPSGVATPAPVPAPTPAPTPVRPLTGRWTGVEGMYLVVSPGERTGTYGLEMQYDLDHKGTFAGTAEGAGIAFTRDGKAEVLRPSDGDATGLKYLAGKTDCLTVKSGEGYCRD